MSISSLFKKLLFFRRSETDEAQSSALDRPPTSDRKPGAVFDVNLGYDQAAKLIDEHRWSDAESALKNILDQDPGFALAHSALTVVLGKLGHHQQAIWHALRLCELAGDDNFSWLCLLKTYQSAGLHEEALAAEQRLRELQREKYNRKVSDRHTGQAARPLENEMPIETLISRVKIIYSKAPAPWVLFAHGTIVSMLSPVKDLPAEACELLARYGPVEIGSETADFGVHPSPENRAWLVTCYHAAIVNYVDAEEFDGSKPGDLAVGRRGRTKRDCDSSELEVVHVASDDS